MKKKIFVVLILGLVIIYSGGWLVFKYYQASLTKCNFSQLVMRRECICPEGYVKFPALGGGAYCATESLKPCSSHTECPENERCISKDGKNWFCSGIKAGCYHWNPENPEDAVCADVWWTF